MSARAGTSPGASHTASLSSSRCNVMETLPSASQKKPASSDEENGYGWLL